MSIYESGSCQWTVLDVIPSPRSRTCNVQTNSAYMTAFPLERKKILEKSFNR